MFPRMSHQLQKNTATGNKKISKPPAPGNKTISNPPAPQTNTSINLTNGTAQNASVIANQSKPTKFIEIEDEEEENKGFLAKLFEKITGAFSLIQLQHNELNYIENFSFTQIKEKLTNLSTPQQINFLITTLHEFGIIEDSLRNTGHNLKKSYRDSQRNCHKRNVEYQKKKEIY